FQVRAMGGTAFLTDDELVLSLSVPRPPATITTTLAPTPGHEPSALPASHTALASPPGQEQPTAPVAQLLRLRFDGATPTAQAAGVERLPGTVNYLLGNQPAKWHTNLPTYAGVVYRDLYPGIDLHYTGEGGLLERSYTLAPAPTPRASAGATPAPPS